MRWASDQHNSRLEVGQICGSNLHGKLLTNIEINVRNLGAVDSILCISLVWFSVDQASPEPESSYVESGSRTTPGMLVHTCRVLVLRNDMLLLLVGGSLVQAYSRQTSRFAAHTLRQLLVDMLRTATGNGTGGQK
jgi:hypothetical protein